MRIMLCSLFALVVSVSTALAAPAPFSKPVPEVDDPAMIERLKAFVFREYSAYADRIERNGGPHEWMVTGNTPVFDGNRMTYEQRYYSIKATEPDRHGSVRFEVTQVSLPRRVITR